ncbi:MAG: ComF family protein [Oscillospiraceae bacterium]|nr:ComF family protein [Oscillospiraceae bacterium]
MACAFFNKIITAFYPDRCLLCGEVVKSGLLCCPKCAQALPFLEEKGAAVHHEDPFSKISAPFWYKDGVRHAIGQMKFYGRKDAAKFFVPYMVQALEDFSPEWVVPVPMAEHRRKERGYNQAELLAEPIAGLLSAEYHPEVLARVGSVAQHDLSARLRRLEANHSFVLANGASPAGKRILLVDDVFTTGSTLRRCAWLLKDAGASEVVCLTIAVTPRFQQD